MHSLVFSTLHVLAISPAVIVNAAGTDFVRPQVRVATTFSDFEARIMDHWGGRRWRVCQNTEGLETPIRRSRIWRCEAKGNKRDEDIREWIPYGADNQSTIAGRPFPFGVWPLYWDQDFMGSSEYGPQYDAIRPGGLIVYVPLRTTQEHFNATENEVYYAVGDRESLLLTMISYRTWCHVTPAWPSKFDPMSLNSMIKLDNVIQYFRASSFALASPAYNNTFARTSASDTTDSTPLPDVMERSPFRNASKESQRTHSQS
ncbi:hypothetical protein FRB91_007116 [Serendipita sp. 411]|nr:hypothetical protein FRB91_007116 [Serendipita sp. 411]